MREYEEEEDRPDIEFMGSPPFPVLVRAAGIIWIVFGGLLLINLLLFLAVIGAVAVGGPKEAGAAAAAGGVCGAAIIGLFAAAFIFVGVQSIKGTARDTLGNSIGSIVFALLNLGGGILQASAGQYLTGIISFLAGAGLLVAGILALVARSDYRAWRKAQRARQGL
jgi:hypothetical protein